MGMSPLSNENGLIVVLGREASHSFLAGRT